MTQPANSSGRQRIIAIGDIHGCALALDTLIGAIRPRRGDTIVTLGDYVDRGPDSRGVLDRLTDLAGSCELIPLLGNHEIMMLEAVSAFNRGGFSDSMGMWLSCGGEETVASYDGTIKNIPESHFAFLNWCRRFYETESHIFVHANYVHDLPMEKQPDYRIFWEHLSYAPPPPHQSGKTVVVGHTPQPSGEILDLGYVVGIDTYCFGTGWLTALDVTTGEIWQANREGKLRERAEAP